MSQTEGASVRPSIAYASLCLCVLFWSGNVIVARALRDDIPPFTLSFWRWLLAFGFLLPLIAGELRAHWPAIRSAWRHLIPAGILGMGAYSTFVYLGLQTTTATNTGLINAIVPVLIAALSAVLYRHRLAVPEGLGVGLSLAGVMAIVLQGEPTAIGRMQVNPGDLWVLLAVAGFVVYTVCFGRAELGLSPGVFLGATMAIAALAIAPLHLWELASHASITLTPTGVAGIVYLALFPSLLSYLFWMKGVEAVGAARAGAFLNLMPLFTTALAVSFLGESLTVMHAIGATLIVAGIWFTASGRYGAKTAAQRGPA